MAGKIKVILNKEGVRELLKSEGVAGECKRHAQRILNTAGADKGYVMEQRNYPERTGFVVKTDNPHAYYSNMKHNTLIRAMK